LMFVEPLRWSAMKYHTHVLRQMGGGQKIVLAAERITVYTASAWGEIKIKVIPNGFLFNLLL
jgi:hypothetical protein